MALQQEYTFTTATVLLTDLATFAVANGWTLVNQTSTSVVVSKNGTELNAVYSSATEILLYATPTGGTKNTSGISFPFIVGYSCMFVSSGRSLLIGRINTGLRWTWGGLVHLSSMMGITGGIGIVGLGAVGATNSQFSFESCGYTTFYVDGAWTTIATPPTSGQIVGIGTNDAYLRDYQPFPYNAGILPYPLPMFKIHTTTTLFRPVGFLENVFRFRGGSVYAHRDIITINGDNYIALASDSSAINSTSTGKDILVKLVA